MEPRVLIDWPKTTGIFTISMFVLVLITLIITLIIWCYNRRIDKYREGYKHYREFENYLGFYKELIDINTEDLKSGKIKYIQNEGEDYIRLLANIGLSLRLRKIGTRELKNFFITHFKGKIYKVILNLSYISKKIPKTDKDNFNFLINAVGKMLDNKKLIGIVEEKFNAVVYGDVYVSGGGHITAKVKRSRSLKLNNKNHDNI